jgi:transposase InsO family protein
VSRLQERFGVSQRRACRVAGQYRSTQRKPRASRPIEETKLRGRLRAIAKRHPRWGYKMAARIVRREGWLVNRKRVQRLWREEGLKRPPQTRKRRRVRPDTTERLTALRPNHVWAIDFQFDETADQRRLKLTNIVDECTREALAMRVGRHCTAEDVIVELEGLIIEYGPPSFLRADNGPELIANALRDWCRFSRIGISYIEPGSPWENPYVESFNGRVRDELLNIEEFGSLLEAQVVVEAWRIEYNTYRPHGALRGLTPAEVRVASTTNPQPALS